MNNLNFEENLNEFNTDSPQQMIRLAPVSRLLSK